MKVKICGITTLQDALAAVEAGANLLGFNFYPPSPRYISPERTRIIVRELRNLVVDVELVGVFVNKPPQAIRRMLDYCELDTAQLSGDETPTQFREVKGKAFKAIRPQNLVEAQQAAVEYDREGKAPGMLLDARVRGKYGGTGKLADWELARSLSGQVPLLLAGGLTPENLPDALAIVTPWGVDVASGVEFSPGRKDHRRMQAFINTALQLV
jgi:phosphoribosylanthranilate isomerase